MPAFSMEKIRGLQPDTSATPWSFDLDGLLLITACHIPEHHLGQLVAMFLEEPLRILEVGQGAIFSTVVELHIGDNEDLGRHILLGHTVLHGSLEDQLKHTLDIGVGDLVDW